MTKSQLALAVAASSLLCLSAPHGGMLAVVALLLIGMGLPLLIVASMARQGRTAAALERLRRLRQASRPTTRLRKAPEPVSPGANDDALSDDEPLSDDEEPTPPTLTLLLREGRYVDAHVVSQAASEAFGIAFQSLPRDEVREQELAERPTVFGEGPLFGVVQGDRVLLVHYQDSPAVGAEEDGVDEPDDARLRRAIDLHTAAVSVQWVGQPDEPSEAEQYRILGKLLAEFVDVDCVAIYSPTDQRLALIDGRLERQLRSSDPRVVFEKRRPKAVYSAGRNDRKLKAAVDEARFRFDEFAKAFERRRGDQLFAVKAPFSNQGVTEYMWVLVGAIENGLIFGTLDNDPVDIDGLHPGDRVRVRRELVNDWMFTDGSRVQGNFTLAALKGK